MGQGGRGMSDACPSLGMHLSASVARSQEEDSLAAQLGSNHSKMAVHVARRGNRRSTRTEHKDRAFPAVVPANTCVPARQHEADVGTWKTHNVIMEHGWPPESASDKK